MIRENTNLLIEKIRYCETVLTTYDLLEDEVNELLHYLGNLYETLNRLASRYPENYLFTKYKSHGTM